MGTLNCFNLQQPPTVFSHRVAFILTSIDKESKNIKKVFLKTEKFLAKICCLCGYVFAITFYNILMFIRVGVFQDSILVWAVLEITIKTEQFQLWRGHISY